MTKEELKKRIAICEYLQNHEVGYLADLKSIAGELFDEFKSLIGPGITSNAKIRYHVTKSGKNIINADLRAYRLKLLEIEKKGLVFQMKN